MQMIIQPGIPTTSPAQEPSRDLRAASGLMIRNAEHGQNVCVLRKWQQDLQTSEFAALLGVMAIITPVNVASPVAPGEAVPPVAPTATPESARTENFETGSARLLELAAGQAVSPPTLPDAARPTTAEAVAISGGSDSCRAESLSTCGSAEASPSHRAVLTLPLVSPKSTSRTANASQTPVAESSMIASEPEQQMRLPGASGIPVSEIQATSSGTTLEVSLVTSNSLDESTDMADANPTKMSPKMLDALDQIGRTSPSPSTARNSVAGIVPARNETNSNPVTVTASTVVDGTGVWNGGGLSQVADTSDPASRITSIEGRKPGGRVSESADVVATDSSSAAPSTSTTAQFSPQSAANPQNDPGTSIPADTRPPLTAQVSRAVMEHIERQGVRQNDSLTVRLDPPELGEMTIQLSRTHEGLAVRVTARESVTMDMLFVRGQEIETHLRGQQLNLKSLEFLRTDMSGDGYSQEQQHKETSRQSEDQMNRIRRGPRAVNHIAARNGRAVTPDSAYGLSFRA